MSKEKFIQVINKSYTTPLPAIYPGGGILEGEILADAKVNLPLRMMNRHGLVTGATGSGKTRTLQLMAEQLSAKRCFGFHARHEGRSFRYGERGIG